MNPFRRFFFFPAPIAQSCGVDVRRSVRGGDELRGPRRWRGAARPAVRVQLHRGGLGIGYVQVSRLV